MYDLFDTTTLTETTLAPYLAPTVAVAAIFDNVLTHNSPPPTFVSPDLVDPCTRDNEDTLGFVYELSGTVAVIVFVSAPTTVVPSDKYVVNTTVIDPVTDVVICGANVANEGVYPVYVHTPLDTETPLEEEVSMPVSYEALPTENDTLNL